MEPYVWLFTEFCIHLVAQLDHASAWLPHSNEGPFLLHNAELVNWEQFLWKLYQGAVIKGVHSTDHKKTSTNVSQLYITSIRVERTICIDLMMYYCDQSYGHHLWRLKPGK
jgi:hypothetical protein